MDFTLYDLDVWFSSMNALFVFIVGNLSKEMNSNQIIYQNLSASERF